MSRALLQAVPDAYVHATVGFLADGSEPIDLDLARAQHDGVVEGMAWLGYDCTVLDADGAGPDAVFVEDPVVVHGGRVVLLRSAHPGRAGEGVRMLPVWSAWGLGAVAMTEPAFADGGDVLVVDGHAYVGISTRTNDAGARQLGALLGLDVTPIPLPPTALHLKCGASPLPGGRVLATRALADALGLPSVIVPDAEAYAANVVARGDRVLCAAGHPCTARALTDAGLDVRLLDLSEFRKGDGSITCLSVREG